MASARLAAPSTMTLLAAGTLLPAPTTKAKASATVQLEIAALWSTEDNSAALPPHGAWNPDLCSFALDPFDTILRQKIEGLTRSAVELGDGFSVNDSPNGQRWAGSWRFNGPQSDPGSSIDGPVPSQCREMQRFLLLPICLSLDRSGSRIPGKVTTTFGVAVNLETFKSPNRAPHRIIGRTMTLRYFPGIRLSFPTKQF